MRITVSFVVALAALLSATPSSAQSDVRPLDRIYGPPAGGAAVAAPRAPGTARPPGRVTGSPAMSNTARPPSAAPGTRPLDRIYGGSGSGRSVGGAAAAGRPSSGSGLGTGRTSPGVGASRKPAGPTYRGGHVGTRPRFSNSPTLSRPRR